MPRAAALSLLVFVLVSPARAAVAPPQEQWLVVTAPAFRDAVEPLCQARRNQGMRVVVLPATDVLTRRDLKAGEAGKLRDRVRALCRAHPGPSFVLLVGAIESVHEDRVVPPLRGVCGRMKGQPTDSGYGGPGAGRAPTVAVGRFPARTFAEAECMVARTLAFEQAQTRPDATGWKRRLTVLAGIPAYNPVIDRLIENMAMSRFGKVHPAWTGRAIYTNPLSRFCLPDRLLRTRALAYLRDGQAFTLYLGHSSAAGLYGGPSVAFLDRDDWARAVLPHGGGVFVSYGCNACQLKGAARPAFLGLAHQENEGYGVAAIRNPHGPAAVIGSQGICFATMVQLAADGLFRAAFRDRLPSRLGTAWLAQMDGIARGKIDFLSYRMLDAVDGDPRIPQVMQRQEHLEMFVLLGDPALRLPQVAHGIRLSARRSVQAGKILAVRGTLPKGLESARVEVRLERPVAVAPPGLVPVPRQPGSARDRVLLANHERANRAILDSRSVTASNGEFQVELAVPDDLPATRAILRVYACTKTEEAMTVQRIEVKKGR
jgi:hypothetical protein